MVVLKEGLWSIVSGNEAAPTKTKVEELAVIGDPVKEEDHVVYLLASLSESYSMLGTALEANPDVPQMEVVTECLLHEERKQKDKEGSGSSFLRY